jgi:hypothetical protein
MTPKQKLASGTLAAALAAGIAVTYITSDGGGFVVAYADKYNRMYAAGEKIVISGQCYSSCTMALAYPNACLMPHALLGFHPGYTPYMFGLFSYTLNQAATDEMKRHYPPDVLAVIDKHGGLIDHGGNWYHPPITVIRATEFPQRYICT